MSTLKVATIQDLSAANSSTPEQVAQGRAKAWVNFNGTGTVAIRDSYRVTSITDGGTGTYTVNLTDTQSSANYCVAISTGAVSGTGTGEGFADTFTTTTFKIRTNNSSGGAAVDFDPVCAALLGD